MAVKFKYIMAAICEKVLIDQDGVPSLIRVFDVFNVPADAPSTPSIQFTLFAALKSAPPISHDPFFIGLTLERANGESQKMPSPNDGKALQLVPPSPDDQMSGINLLAQCTMKVESLETCHIAIDIDGTVICRLPITIRKLREPASQSEKH